MKKRIIVALALALSLSLALCACGGNSKSSKKSSKKTESSKDDDDEKESKKKKKKKKEKEETAPAVEEAPAAEEPDITIAEEPDLEAFINSREMQNTINLVNEQLAASGMVCEIGANGNDTLVLKYTFVEQKNLGNASKKDIESSLDQELTPILNEMGAGMVEDLAKYGFSISNVEIIICNADGSILYDKTHRV